jgi:tetratricopeptide (TPR) repeat protein
MRHVHRLIIITALVASSTWAWAQTGGAGDPSAADMERARQLFQSAEAHKKTGDGLSASGDTAAARESYRLAAGDYLAGYQLSKLPLFLYNLGSIYRLRGNKQWAIRCYRAFIDTKPDDEKDMKDALTFVAELKQDLAGGAQEADLDPSIDPAGVCVLEEEASPDRLDLAPAEPVPAEPETSPPGAQDLDEPVDQPAAASGGWYRTGFWAAAGVTVASIGISVTTMLQTRNFKDEKVDAILEYQQTSGMQLDPNDACADAEGRDGAEAVVDACHKGKGAALMSNVFQGVALVGAVASGYLFYKGYLQKSESGRAPASATRITPVLTPSAVGAEFTLRF